MDLKNAIEKIDNFEEINLEGIRKILSKVTLEDSDLDQEKYSEFRTYLDSMYKAKVKRRENSFDNRVGVLDKLRSLY